MRDCCKDVVNIITLMPSFYMYCFDLQLLDAKHCLKQLLLTLCRINSFDIIVLSFVLILVNHCDFRFILGCEKVPSGIK